MTPVLSISGPAGHVPLPSKSRKPSLQDLKTFLSDFLKSFSHRISIILDGFDECKDGRTAIIDGHLEAVKFLVQEGGAYVESKIRKGRR